MQMHKECIEAIIKQKEYIKAIIKQLERCQDIELLDLIYQLLIKNNQQLLDA